MVKKLFLILCIIAFSLSASGCMSARQINEMAYVVGVGIDKGENEKILLSLQFAKPFVIAKKSEEGQEEEKKDKSTSLATAEGTDIFSAIKKIESTLSKQINLTHTKILVFSDDIAKEGVLDYVETLMANNQFRPNTYTALALGSAKDYFEEEKPALENNPAKYYTMMFSKDTKSNLTSVSLRDLYFNTSFKSRAAVLPVLGKDKGGGMAIFKGDKLFLTLSEENAEVFNILSGDFKEGYIKVAGKNGDYSVKLKQRKMPKICVKINGEQIKAEIKIKATVQKSVSVGEEDSVSNIKNEILNKAEEFLLSTYGQGVDVLGISRFAKKDFLSQKEWEDYGFSEKVKNIQFQTSAEIKEESGDLIK